MSQKGQDIMDKEVAYFGAVIFFNISKGYGFLSWEINAVKQKDIFVHFSDINMEGFKALQKDQKVTFQIGKNYHGDPKAINVTLVK